MVRRVPTITQSPQALEQLRKALLWSTMGQLQQQLDHFAIAIRLQLVTMDRAAECHDTTGQALAHLELLTDAGNQLSFDRRL